MKAAIYALNSKIAWLKRRQRISPDGFDRINIGCGLVVAPGWLNIDSSPFILFAGWPKFINRRLAKIGVNKEIPTREYCRILSENRFIYHDIRYGLPLPDASITYAYSSHILEHFYKDEALELLRGIYRILKPGGLVRIAIPDLEYALKLYYDGKKEKGLKFMFSPKNFSVLSRHRYMYDFEMLKTALESAGFADICKCEYQKGRMPDIEKLDNRPEESIYAEAVKP